MEFTYFFILISAQKSCTICGEDFDVIWKSDINDWVLDNALIVKVVESANQSTSKDKKNGEMAIEEQESKSDKDKKNSIKKPPKSKKIKEKKSDPPVTVLKKICMHPECYHVLAVQDELEKSPKN